MIIGMLMALGAAILWGANGVFINWIGAYGATGSQITAMRILTVPFVMAGYLWIKDRSQMRINLRDLGWFALNGIVGMYLFALFYTYTIQRVGMGTAAVLVYLMPAMVSIYGVIVRKEKMTLKKGIVLLMSVAACGLVSGLASGFVFQIGGLLFGLGSAACYALYSILMSERLGKYTANTANFYSFLFAAPCAVFYAGMHDGFTETINFYVQHPQAMLLGMIYGVLCFMITYLLYSTAVRRIGVSTASILTTFEPVAAALFGFLLFHEQLDGWAILGIVIEVAALILMVIEPAPKKNE